MRRDQNAVDWNSWAWFGPLNKIKQFMKLSRIEKGTTLKRESNFSHILPLRPE